MERLKWIVLGVALFAGAAGAVSVGGKLYIKAKNTKLLADPSPTANVLAVLQPGAEVVWQGSATPDKKWHKVTADGQSGVVFASNLSPSKPNDEVLASAGNKTVDSKAFASSAAATKALGEAAIEYGQKKNMKDAVNELMVLEALAKQIDDSSVAEHAKKAGLNPVVGDKK